VSPWTEIFECPFCGVLRRASQDAANYYCNAMCNSCNEHFNAVDSMERCKECPSRLDCLTEAVVVCISSEAIDVIDLPKPD
jgi:hypothetical protein